MEDIKKIVELGNVLKNPFRVEILKFCSDKECSINEVKKMLEVTYANTHKHIRLLEKVGLVITRKDLHSRGQIVYVKSLYRVVNDKLEKLD